MCLFNASSSYLCVCSSVRLFCDPIDGIPPDPSVHRIFQARIWEGGAISSSRRSSQPRDQTRISWVSALAGGFFTTSAPLEVTCYHPLSVGLPLTGQWPEIPGWKASQVEAAEERVWRPTRAHMIYQDVQGSPGAFADSRGRSYF